MARLPIEAILGPGAGPAPVRPGMPARPSAPGLPPTPAERDMPPGDEGEDDVVKRLVFLMLQIEPLRQAIEAALERRGAEPGLEPAGEAGMRRPFLERMRAQGRPIDEM